MIGAAACIALPFGNLAVADGRGQGRGGDRSARVEQQRGPPDRAPSSRGGQGRRFEDRRGPPRGYERRDDRRRFDDRREERRDDRRGRWDDDDRGPRYEGRPPPESFAPPRARRGGYLPDQFRGGVIEDYRRYRLRPPPHGYAWVRVGNGFALVSESSGQVFDIIPD